MPLVESGPVRDGEIDRLIGSWSHPSFATLHINRDNILDQLPPLRGVPASPLLWDCKRILLAPSAKAAVFDGCFELGDGSLAVHGAHFQLVLGLEEDQIAVIGWNGDSQATYLRKL